MKKGFHIFDFLNILLILALLASLAVPVWKAEQDKIKYKQSVADLKSISSALEKFYLETGSWLAFAQLSDISSTSSVLVQEGYLAQIPANDRWNRPFQGTGSENGYELKGYAIPTRSPSLMRAHPDYTIVTGGKLKKSAKIEQ
jgi:type II secretory pathway pseudopilin PulG